MTDGPNSDGWVKLHRKILEHPKFHNDKWLRLWIYLLLKANHKAQRFEFNGSVIDLMPGELIAGKESIGLALKMKASTVGEHLARMERGGEIRQRITFKGRVISILNWESYQSIRQQTVDGQISDSQLSDTYKNDKNVRIDNTTSAPPAFRLPTKGEVVEYAALKPWKMEDVEKFFHFYDAVGWLDDKNRPIVNWQSKMNYWMSNQRQMDYQRKNPQGELLPTKPIPTIKTCK